MTCCACDESVMKDCREVTRVIHKFDHSTRQTVKKIYTFPPTIDHHQMPRIGGMKTSYHNLQQYYGTQKQQQIILAARCGHIFHKNCLRGYILNFRDYHRVNFALCPACNQNILLSATIVLDIKIHNGLTTTDRKTEQAKWMHLELLDQVGRYQGQIEEIEQQIVLNRNRLLELRQEKVATSREFACRKMIENQLAQLKDSINHQKAVKISIKEENKRLVSVVHKYAYRRGILNLL